MNLIKKTVLLLVFISVFVQAQEIPKKAYESITAEELLEHLKFLASDEMRGRDTPSPELKKCAEYIAEEFKSYGLKPAGDDGGYLQVINCYRKKLDMTAGPDGIPNKFAVINRNTREDLVIKSDFSPFNLTGTGEITAPVVFAGFGITAPEFDYDDYKDIDVKGKIVLVMQREPQDKDSTSIFNGLRPTRHANRVNKYRNAFEHGAAGFIIVKAPSEIGRRPTIYWPSLRRIDRPTGLSMDLGELIPDIPAIYVSKAAAEKIVSGTGKTLAELQQAIDKDLKPQSFEMPNIKAYISTKIIKLEAPTQNVVGFLEGSDPELKDELVIIGAHYDHVGVRGDSVYNGSDDNASGTCAVIEAAEAFGLSEQKPKRSILFIAFAGEEKGLFGSRYYAENPYVPLEKTVAMLDIDMCSRNEPNEIAIVGSTYNPDLLEITKEANGMIGLNFTYDMDRYIRQSDHFPFLSRQVPALFYYSKTHEDLHRPTDDVEKAQPDKMQKVTRLVFNIAWITANSEKRPKALPFE